MQTFLPYPDFRQTAACLDMRRLGKQRVETFQILRALRDPSRGWQNHPAVLMWRGYEQCLAAYGVAICDEWLSRGYRDTCRAKIIAQAVPSVRRKPSWLGSPRFHRSHRSNLLRKFPEHYVRFWPRLSPELPYVWPV